jgi:hypothetical protein
MTFTPYFMILDPELMKKILIKDFGKFRNNDFNGLVSLVLMRNWQEIKNVQFQATEKKDPMMYFNPFLSTDDMWKEKRAEIAPSMTQNRVRFTNKTPN